MAGGIDWFRWHHGSVTDPKFALVARNSGASLPDVLAVWAYLLETASAATERGSFSEIDAEALDCIFNFPNTETRTADILRAMEKRGLIADGHVIAWERRQPKREREQPQPAEGATAPKTSTERSREHRAKKSHAEPSEAMQRHATPCNASDDQETPREEERREEEKREREIPPAAARHPEGVGRFSEFWAVWPKSARKESRGPCEKLWAKHRLDAKADAILAHVGAMSKTENWTKQGRQFVPAPLVYLRGERWDGAEIDVDLDGMPAAAALDPEAARRAATTAEAKRMLFGSKPQHEVIDA